MFENKKFDRQWRRGKKARSGGESEGEGVRGGGVNRREKEREERTGRRRQRGREG